MDETKEYAEVIFELTPIFNDGILEEGDVAVFLEQVARTLRILEPLSAKLDDLFIWSNGKFDCDPTFSADDEDCNREFVRQIVADDKSFIMTVEISTSINSSSMTEFLASMSDDENRFVIFWQFDIDLLDFFKSDEPSHLHTPLSAISFTFGNLINGNRFITHLNDLGTTFNAENVAAHYNIISDVFVQTNGKFNVLCKINFYDQQTSCYDSKWCKFQFEPDSVNEIVTSLHKGIEFYFHLDFPPKLYLSQDGFEDSCDNDDSNTSDLKNRWIDTELICRETIGKCNTFMIKFDFNSAVELAPIMQIMYSDFFEKSHPISLVPISRYCVDYPDGLFENNFPFEVKYALECINSLSNALKDDLYVNGTKDTFYNLISTKINEDNCLIVEALYQLFQEFVDGDVHNACTDFGRLLEELQMNIGERITRDNLVKKIVLTPTRTIYLPPTPTRTKFMIENVSNRHMILVYFRDDDKAYTSCDSYSTNRDIADTDFNQFLSDDHFRDYFFEEIVQKRLFQEHGLISAEPFRYLGTSVVNIFSYAILILANAND